MLSPEVSKRMKTVFGFDREPSDVDELIEQFRRRWLRLPDDIRQVMSSLFLHFMRHGTWPAMEDITRHSQGRPLREVKESLDRAIQAGYIQAESESNRYRTRLWVGTKPTTHQVQVKDGVTINAGCAVDGLWVFSFVSEDGTLLTACPHCGEPLHVGFKHGEITKWEPEDMLLFQGVMLDGKGSAGELVCPFTNLFPNGEHLEAWLSKVPGVAGVALNRSQAQKLAQVVVPEKPAKPEFVS